MINKAKNITGLFISLYLPVTKSSTRSDLTSLANSQLKDLLNSTPNLSESATKTLESAILKIKDYLDIIDTRGVKTVAFFSGTDFFEVLKLPLEIPLKAHADKKLFITPLTTATAENPPFILVLVDRNAAKVIEINISGKDTKSQSIKSDVPQRILPKGENMGMEDKILRHIEDHLHRHLLKVSKELNKFESLCPNGLVVIGAQKELVGKFKKLLSKSLQNKVIGSFGANVDDPETEVKKKAQKIVDYYLVKKAYGQV